MWRLKWHPADRHLILAACMYNGFAVVRTSEQYSQVDIIEEYKGHSSIAYGADWYWGDTGWLEQNSDMKESSAQQHPSNAYAPTAEPVQSAASRHISSTDDSEGQPVSVPAECHEQQQAHVKEPSTCRSSTHLVATCSFYDKRLHLWTPSMTAGVAAKCAHV